MYIRYYLLMELLTNIIEYLEKLNLIYSFSIFLILKQLIEKFSAAQLECYYTFQK